MRHRRDGKHLRGAAKFVWSNVWKAAALAAILGAVISLNTDDHGYDATAQVMVRPNAVDATFFQNDTQSLLDTEAAVVRSSEVVTAAAKTVPGIDPAGLASALMVQTDARHSTLRISVRADTPMLARTLTNSVASTYLASIQARSDVGRRSTVSVTHEAAVADDDSGTQTAVLYAAIGALLGGAAALVISLLRRGLDPRLLDPSALENLTGRPLVGHVPDAAIDDGRLVMIADPTSSAADSYRSLVSTIPFFALEEGVRCVAVTGSSHGGDSEGSEVHTDVATNLAIACAQSGIRTMLVAGDLRHDAILGRQLQPGSKGLTDLILARAPWRDSETWRSSAPGQLATGDVVYMTSIANLAFVPTGRTAPNPGDVLSSRAAGVALSHLKHLCDLVILDTPNFANPETANIVRYAETVIAVVSAGSTRKASLQTLAASTELQGVPLYFVLKESGRSRRRAKRAAAGNPSRANQSVPAQSVPAQSAPVQSAPAPWATVAEPASPTPAPPVHSPPVHTTPQAPPMWWTPPVAAPVVTSPQSAPAPAAPPPAEAATEAPAPYIRPTELPGRATEVSAAPEPAASTAMAAPIRKKSAPQSRGNAWRTARLAAKRAERAVRNQAPPRGKQY